MRDYINTRAGSRESFETNLEIAKIDRGRTTEITDQLRTVQSKLAELQPKLDAARDEAGTLGVAYQMEIAASSSYVFALGELQGEHALQVTGSIMPVESQHAVVLGQALGKTPTTDPNFLPSFVTDANKIDPAKFPMP